MKVFHRLKLFALMVGIAMLSSSCVTLHREPGHHHHHRHHHRHHRVEVVSDQFSTPYRSTDYVMAKDFLAMTEPYVHADAK